MSHDTNEKVVSHKSKNHVTQMNESWHKWVSNHVTQMNESWHRWISRATQINCTRYYVYSWLNQQFMHAIVFLRSLFIHVVLLYRSLFLFVRVLQVAFSLSNVCRWPRSKRRAPLRHTFSSPNTKKGRAIWFSLIGLFWYMWALLIHLTSLSNNMRWWPRPKRRTPKTQSCLASFNMYFFIHVDYLVFFNSFFLISSGHFW